MLTYIYVGEELYKLWFLNPMREMQSGDTVEVTEKEAKKLDPMYFVKVGKDSIDAIKNKIASVKEGINSIDEEKKAIRKSLEESLEKQFDGMAMRKNEQIQAKQNELKGLEKILKLLSPSAKKETK